MSNAYTDSTRRPNGDWPVVKFPDRLAPINRVYYDDFDGNADEVIKFPKLSNPGVQAGVTCAANTAGALDGLSFTVTDRDNVAWLVVLDGLATHTREAAAVHQIVVKLAVGATAAAVATSIAQRMMQTGGVFLATTDGAGVLWIMTHKMRPAITDLGSSTFAATTGNPPDILRPGVPPECVLGSYHPECPYLRLVDCWLVSSSDNISKFRRVWQVDVHWFAANASAQSVNVEAMLAGGGPRQTSFPYFHKDSPEITWTFEVCNPESYVKGAQLLPLPCYPDALLISEQSSQSGVVLTVTRTYKRIATLVQQRKLAFIADSEFSTASNRVVVWEYDTWATDYAPLAVGALCPLSNGGVGSSLVFTGLVVMKPPVYTAQTTDYGRVTVTFGKVAGPALAGSVFDNGDVLMPGQFVQTLTKATSAQTVAAGTAADTGASVISSQVSPVDSVRSQKQTETLVSQVGATLLDSKPDMETGQLVSFYKSAVAAGSAGSAVDSSGNYSEVDSVNPTWSIKTTGKATTLPTSQGSARRWYTRERGDWPDVLTSLQVWPILDADKRAVADVMSVYHIRKGYTGYVNVMNEEWWQKSPPSLQQLANTEMLTSEINIAGVYFKLSIGDCLHAAYRYVENNAAGYDTSRQRFRNEFYFPATPLLDWPASYVGPLKVMPENGGYRCLRKTFYRPSNYLSMALTSFISTRW